MTQEADARVEARVVSVTPGRLRLRLPARHRETAELRGLEKTLEQRSEIADVQANPRTGSIILRYDPQQVTADELRAALAEAGVDAVREPVPSDGARTAGADPVNAAGAVDRWVRATTGGGDLRTLLPIGLAALSLRQALRDVPGLDRAPWYLLAWYAFDSFVKLNDPTAHGWSMGRADGPDYGGEG